MGAKAGSAVSADEQRRPRVQQLFKLFCVTDGSAARCCEMAERRMCSTVHGERTHGERTVSAYSPGPARLCAYVRPPAACSPRWKLLAPPARLRDVCCSVKTVHTLSGGMAPACTVAWRGCGSAARWRENRQWRDLTRRAMLPVLFENVPQAKSCDAPSGREGP